MEALTVTEIMTVMGPDQALNSIFLADFSDRIGKTKRTGYESGEYEMVCCLCVDGNSAAILSSGHLRQSRDIGGILGSSLVGGSLEAQRDAGEDVLSPCYWLWSVSRPPALCRSLSEDVMVGYNTLTNSDWIWISYSTNLGLGLDTFLFVCF